MNRSGLLGEQGLTRSCTAAASLCTNAAMLHVLAMFRAVGTANLACLDAGTELRAGEFEVSLREPRDDARSGEADVGAIVATADAVDQFSDILLAEACVGARVAGFEA